MKYKHILLLIIYSLAASTILAQPKGFKADSILLKSINPLRACYDVHFYDLNLKINIPEKSLSGSNKFFYKVISDFEKIQIDLFNNFNIDSIVYENKKLRFTRDSNKTFIFFSEIQKKGNSAYFTIHYQGRPIVAKNAPWDGGFVWERDSLGNPWIGVACEGIGASSWWPCKDHPSEEPDSVQMTFTVPSNLQCVANGNLKKKEEVDNSTSYTWFVSYPINAYNVTLNIAKYEHFSDIYTRKNGSKLLLDYYVLSYNLLKAKKHFEQVSKILEAYENILGEYPFIKDGYALVETPYWGMEHQSAIAYGNNYKNQLREFDFIIVHETAHEWWGNSITAAEKRELWIHESFATYTESLLMEYFYGYNSSIDYLSHQKQYIQNQHPMLTPLNGDVFHKDNDIYYKGAWMLHTLRNVIANDTLWFKIIKNLTHDFKYSIVNTNNIIEYFNVQSGADLSSIFDQYLNYSSIPTLVYSKENKGGKTIINYKWIADVKKLKMPVKVELSNKTIIKLAPSDSFQTFILNKREAKNLRIMTEFFYINTKDISK